MRTVRVYDATREPRDWMDIVRPGQFAAFASLLDGGTPCDAEGVPTSYDAATCTILDSLAEAEAFCRARVERHRGVRFDVFDAAGRSRSPLLTVVHPTQTGRLEGHAGHTRRNATIAIVLIVAAVVFAWIEYRAGGALVLPGLIAFNALVLAARLLQLNAAYAAAERQRRARIEGDGASEPDET